MKYFQIPFEEMDELERINEEKIEAFNRLPFWKKWGKHEQLKQEIISSWRVFDEKYKK